MSSNTDEFKGWRNIFFPIHRFEFKKFFPMGIMMMMILFNYTIFRDIKDVLINTQSHGADAGTLSFLKLYCVTPAAILYMIVFMKMANVMTKETLFYSVLMPFLIFYCL